MKQEYIIIKGAREHNLNIAELKIPKHKLVVFTGVSGSGKSSLAFDTLYAEGQRRYVESLSSYARQFLGQLEKPHYEKLTGLAPTIAIEQKAASSNPRSTVGTVTEIYDYFRVLWARAGTQYCHQCGREVSALTSTELVHEIESLPLGTKLVLLAPLLRERKGEHREILEQCLQRGFTRARLDGQIERLGEVLPQLAKNRKHTVEIAVDRVTVGQTEPSRLADSVEIAIKEGSGEIVLLDEAGAERRFCTTRACAYCKAGFSELSPLCFSFNSPLGACEACSGLGTRLEIDPALLVPDDTLSIRGGAIRPWANVLQKSDSWNATIFNALARERGIDLDRPWRELPRWQRQLVLNGTGQDKIQVKWKRHSGSGTMAMKFEGVAKAMLRRLHQTNSAEMREFYRQYLSQVPCTECGGARLKPESRAVRLGGKSISDVTAMSVSEARLWIAGLELAGVKAVIASEVLSEIGARLGFLNDVGLDYLTLNRLAPTLSGGEAQRIRLASQLGSELSGVMYVLDEPSIGLHPRDGEKLLDALTDLRDLGNSVIVVEHDRGTIERADHVVDFGPGAGRLGGRVIAQGTPKQISDHRHCLTGDYLAGREKIEPPRFRRAPKGWLKLNGCCLNNLKEVNLELPLGVLSVFTGVSGAGKSSLLVGTVLSTVESHLGGVTANTGTYRSIGGLEQLDKVIHIDQKPIGRTPRSNPVTYTKAFDQIRAMMAQTAEARAFGFGPDRFSFNVRGGRCEACGGAGTIKVEMHFLADVNVPCEVCHGQRYNEATLRVTYKGKNIREILDMTIAEALGFFSNFPNLRHTLETLDEVGMGYVQLGQPATTLSGGEAQRIKLSRELSKRATGRTLYILDEPTTGLHFHDVKKLLEVLGRLVDHGNSVAIIEHNLDVVKCADWIIDLGPGGGDAGGHIIAAGPPERVAADEHSHTGRYLRSIIGGRI
jgi:excinuclease ABC subunit A